MRLVAPLTLAALLALPSVAHADDPPGVHEHDGFYLRFGVGPGFAFGSNKADALSADVSGVEVATELAVGTTVTRGLVVGLGQFSMIVPSPRYAVNALDSTAGAHHISAVGPFADYYLDARRGLHVQAGVLFSAGYLTGKDGRESGIGLGFAGMLGVGYEVFIGEQWSLGPLLRLTYYRQSVEGSDSKATSTLSLLAPTLLLGVTYH